MIQRDRFVTIANQLIADLSAMRGDDAAEQEALQRAIDSYVAAARHEGDTTPVDELMIPELFCEDSFEDGLSVIERAAGDAEDDEFRWREMFADLCGY